MENINIAITNERLLIQSHVNGIFDHKLIQENSLNSSKLFMDTLTVSYDLAEILKQQLNEWSPLLIFLCLYE